MAGPRGRGGHHPHHARPDPRSRGFVDAQVAAVAGRLGAAQLDRLVAETIKRYDLADVDPTADPEDGYLHVDPRHVSVDTNDVHFAGTMRMEAELDIADVLDLDRASPTTPRPRPPSAPTEPLSVRRAKALGDLARTQTALDLHAHGAAGAPRRRRSARPHARSSSTPTSTPRSTT